MIGHSQEVAAMHYDDLLESDFAKAKATSFRTAVPAGKANGSVQMSVEQNDDLLGTQDKVDLATKIQAQMQRPAANCRSSTDWKVPPRGVEPLLPD